MAPSARKTRDWREREGITKRCCSCRLPRKFVDALQGARAYGIINSPKLGPLNIDRHNQGVQRKRHFERRCATRSRMQGYRERQKLLYDSSNPRGSSESVGTSGYRTESVPTSIENLTEMMDAANSSRPSSSAESSLSNVSVEPISPSNPMDNTRALLKKKSLVQIINNYIKAGIEEGKRQAKKYIRKALSFGVRSGYLIPVDPKGQMLHVSSKLVTSRKSDAESRKRRRRIRRGEEVAITVDQKPLHRRTVRNRSLRNDSTDVIVPGGRKRRLEAKSSGMEANDGENSRKKTLRTNYGEEIGRAKRHRGKKPKIAEKVVKRRRRPQNHRESEKVRGRPMRKHRHVLSASTDRNERDVNRSRNYRDREQRKHQDKSKVTENEADRRTVTERRKSVSRGDEWRDDKVEALQRNEENDDVEERNDEGRSEGGSNENDGNETIREDA